MKVSVRPSPKIFQCLVVSVVFSGTVFSGPFPGTALGARAIVPAAASGQVMALRTLFPLPSGHVFSPDGQPVTDVHVYLAYRHSVLMFDNGKLTVSSSLFNKSSSRALITRTNQTGAFHFAPQTRDYMLVVCSKTGYAEVTAGELAVSSRITLKSWCMLVGSIYLPPQRCLVYPSSVQNQYPPRSQIWPPRKRGVTYRVYRVGAGKENLAGMKFTFVYFEVDTFPDSHGRYVLGHVPSGPISISLEKQVDSKNVVYPQGMPRIPWYFPYRQQVMILNPGQLTRVNFGGTGRPVIGKIAWPAKSGRSAGMAVFAYLTRLQHREIPYPVSWFSLSHTEKKLWMNHWIKTPAGYKYSENQTYCVRIHQDGSFRIAGVPPGKYVFSYDTADRGYANQQWFLSSNSAPPPRSALSVHVPFRVRVPSLVGGGKNGGDGTLVLTPPGGRSTKPLNLGMLKLIPKIKLKMGDVAPPFVFQKLGGSKIKLANFKGKVVLLDFWAWPGLEWHNRCFVEMPTLRRAEMPIFQKLYHRFGGNRHFTMISIATDTNIKMARKYMKFKRYPWIQVLAGRTARHSILADYVSNGFHSIVLIGINGKVVATWARWWPPHSIVKYGQIVPAIVRALAAAR